MRLRPPRHRTAPGRRTPGQGAWQALLRCQAGPGAGTAQVVLATIVLAPADLAVPLLALGWTWGTEDDVQQSAPPAWPRPAVRPRAGHRTRS